MRIARFFIHGFPVIILVLIAAAFLNSALLSTAKKNEMSVGMSGEPSSLNPIQQADSASAQVFSSIFNSLLKYSPDLEIIGDLATSWQLSQTSTVVFRSPSAAEAARNLVESWKGEWTNWTLVGASVTDNHLRLTFQAPGLTATETIVSRFDPQAIAPLTTFHVEIKEGARKVLAKLHQDVPGIVRDWIESGSSLEVTCDPSLMPALEKSLASTPGAKIEMAGPVKFFAEPEVVFHLREGVRWHDGAPFSSHDVLFTYQAIMSDEIASPRKPDFDLIRSIETPDPLTVHVTYRKPYSPALNSWMIEVLPAHILENQPVAWWAEHFNRAPIGTGPFKFSHWKTNEFIRVVRNPDYFLAPAPWLDAVVYRFLPNPLTLRMAFETKQIDFWAADPWAVAAFQADRRFDVYSTPANQYTYIGWNLRRPLFQDVRVRQALAHAVNVPAMVKFILYGHGLQSKGIFTPQMWFFDPNGPLFAYDPEKSKALLDEAGWKPGPDGIRVKNGQRFSFTLITNNANEVRRDIATLTQDGLKKIGIDVQIELYEWSVFLKDHVNKGDFDAMVLGWSLGNDFDQYQIWHSSQTNPEQLNVVNYKNPAVDRLLESIRQEFNREKIIRLAGEMQRTIYRDQPYLFLYVPESTSVMWKGTFRIHRPDDRGGWIDSPVEMTKAGWAYWSDWFYRPDFASRLPVQTH